MRALTSLLIPLCLAAAARAEVIEGSVDFTGTPPAMGRLRREADPVCAKKPMNDESVLVKDRKLLNVWVHVTAGAPDAKAPDAPVVVDQVDCMYRPRVVTAMVGQKVLAKNSDPTLHNVHARAGGASVFNRPMLNERARPIEYVAEKEGVMTWRCDVHPWMRGYVGVSRNPHQATTGETGDFRLADVPPGKYKLEAWHERYGAKTAEVTVEKGKAAKVRFSFDGTEKAP